MRKIVLSLLTLSLLSATPPPASVSYRFDEVKRSVMLTTPSSKQEIKAAKGQNAMSGDQVRTGWFSYALIASEQHRAKFELFSGTDVELAGGSPGVILSLKRGRLHAMFDKITGTEPRVVQTPGALLAVRGTQYTVEVDSQGQTMLDVFEGIVEVRSPMRPDPLFVHAGESSDFARRERPEVHQTPPDRGPDGQRNRGDDRNRDSHDPNGRDPRDGGPDNHGPDDHGQGPNGGQKGGPPPPPATGTHH
jgi:hypothetical protein